MKYVLTKLKSLISLLSFHPKTLGLTNNTLENDDFLKDHNTWFI
jgi:hypothetical protein